MCPTALSSPPWVPSSGRTIPLAAPPILHGDPRTPPRQLLAAPPHRCCRGCGRRPQLPARVPRPGGPLGPLGSVRGAIVAADDSGVRSPLPPVTMLLVVARVEGLQVHLHGGVAPWTPWSRCSTGARRCWRKCCPSQPRTSSSPLAEWDRALRVLLKSPAPPRCRRRPRP